MCQKLEPIPSVKFYFETTKIKVIKVITGLVKVRKADKNILTYIVKKKMTIVVYVFLVLVFLALFYIY